jgi:hypothetical protein
MNMKTGSLLLAGCIILLMILPASAYDYQGVPVQGSNNPDNADQMSEVFDSGMSSITSLLENTDFASLITLILNLIIGLLGISSS